MSSQHDSIGQQACECSVQLQLELRFSPPAPTARVYLFPIANAVSAQKQSAEDIALAKVLAYAERLAL